MSGLCDLRDYDLTDAERIASDVLYGDDYHDDTLRRIGADDAATFFKRLNEERRV